MIEIYQDANHDRGKAMGYVTEASQGKPYVIELHSNHVQVIPPSDAPDSDWRKDFTEEEKLQIFDRILIDYRHRTIGDNGFVIAALGVTKEGDIYISGNAGEEHSSSPFHRHCAERSMVKVAADRDAYNRKSEHRRSGLPLDDFKPRFVDFEALYLKGGNAKNPMVAPCGDCTDMLIKRMPPEGKIYMLPNDEERQELRVNTKARYITEVKPGEVWLQTIEQLNANHALALPPAMMVEQRQAFDVLCETIARHLEHGTTIDPHYKLEELQPTHRLAIGTKTADLLRDGPKISSPMALNRFLRQEIQRTALDRVRTIMGKDSDRDYSPAHIKQVIMDKIGLIRCSAVQLDDGQWSAGIASVSTVDKASTSAELGALNNAMSALGTSGVYRVRSMEFSPAAIAEGVMRTPDKSSVERLLKRASKLTKTIEFGFIPYNAGQLSTRDVQDATQIRMTRELLPGLFSGTGDLAKLHVFNGTGTGAGRA